MIDDVAVLYVDARGPYPGLVLQWFDEDRDARTYAGPWPVVAHPPCGPWSALRRFCSSQEAACAPHAVDVVRCYGGVLEHPAGSTLWAHCGMPRPGELPDRWGGRTLEVQQCDWGHVARKRTWLYIVGAGPLPPRPEAREPTHWASGSRGARANREGASVPEGIKVCSARQRRRTPPDFAAWLLEVARTRRNSPRGC